MDLKGKLFKFVDDSDDFFFRNLKNRELIARHYSDFNDPYESFFAVNSQWPSPYKEKKVLVDLINIVEPQHNFTYETQSSVLNSFIKSKDHYSQLVLDSIVGTLDSLRYCSFSRQYNQILMWGHYANKFKGAALVFDQSKITMIEEARSLKEDSPIKAAASELSNIVYRNKPSVIDSVQYYKAVRSRDESLMKKVRNNALEACALTKYKTWRYEQETRLITHYPGDIGNSAIVYKYDESALKAIVFGCKADTGTITEASKIMPEGSYVYLTKMVKSRYKIVISEKFIASDIASGKVNIGTITI